MSGQAGDADDLDRFVAARLERYVDLVDAAGAKLTAGNYHAADLVDDWFRWVGMVAQDTTAAITLALGATATQDRGSPPGDAGPSGAGR